VLIRTVLAALLIGTVPVLGQPPVAIPPPGQPPRQQPAGRGDQPGGRGDQPTPASAPRTLVTPAPTPRREGQPVNIKIDFTIIDQRGSAAAIKRTLTLIVADERTGSIRSQSSVFQVGDVPLNVDASPSLLTDGKIRLGFNLQYDWPAPLDAGSANPTTQPPRGTVIKTALHDSVVLILESGKPRIAAQSADPIGDRQVTVEVKATVLR
jgi:hypothetical protein